MFSHRLSKLPAPKAADWGFNVSVGIVVICDSHKGIVCITDSKATFADFSADNAALKTRRIYRKWWVAFAGDDVEYAQTIIESVAESLGSSNAAPIKTTRQVVTALDNAYWDVLHSQIESRVLRKQKFTVDSFRETGSKRCTTTIYNNLCAKIDRVELSLQFLLYGFDERGKAHIYVVDGHNAPKCYDAIGVWAVGSGAHAALSSLAFHIDKRELIKYTTTPEEAVYFACEAKFMAETSGYVGRDDAMVTIHRADQAAPEEVEFLFQNDISQIKDLWKAQGAPRVPPSAGAMTTRLLSRRKEPADKPTPSDSETSEPEP